MYSPGSVQKAPSGNWAFDVRSLSDEAIENVNVLLRTHAPMSGYSSILASQNMKMLSEAVDFGSNSAKRKRQAEKKKTDAAKAKKVKTAKTTTKSNPVKQRKSDETTFVMSGITVNIIKKDGETRRKLE